MFMFHKHFLQQTGLYDILKGTFVLLSVQTYELRGKEHFSNSWGKFIKNEFDPWTNVRVIFDKLKTNKQTNK